MAKLDHLALSVKNFAESREWYSRVFGFSCVEEGNWSGRLWGVLRSRNSTLCIYEHPHFEPPSRIDDLHPSRRLHRIYHFALAISDRREWEDTLVREQLEVQHGGPIHYPHSTSWYIMDPSGYEIEVVHWTGGTPCFD